jgi:hypothetical protein
MKMRTTALILAGSLVAGCSGNVNHLLPSNVTGEAGAGAGFSRTTATGVRGLEPSRRHIRTLVRIRIPRRTHVRAAAHPASISPLTQSLSIAVNTGAAVVFNTTPSSPGCTTASSGTTCTFAVSAPVGTDTFTVTTYDAAGGGGTALDRGVVTVPISAGKANQVAIALGPVVTNTNDTGMGSLRYAVGSANTGDTIMFLLPSGSTIALATPITIAKTVNIAGPSASSIAISGGGTHQIFLIIGTATISGLTLTQGNAAASNPGGAIYNIGSVTLANDVIGNSTSNVAIRRAPRVAKRDFEIVTHKLHPHCTTVYHEGGALYNDIQSNVAGCIDGEGGAIYNDQYGSLTSTGDTYSNNSAIAGGAVYNAGVGSVSFTGDTFSGNTGCTASSGCPTSGCGATSCTSNAAGSGAAIFDHGLGVTVVNSTFTNNVAGGATAGSLGTGGAIYLDTPSVLPSITGSTFTGNLAGGGTSSCSTGEGGAILANNAVELDNDTFTNNAATGDHLGVGGAVVGLASLTGTGDTFSGNSAVGSGGPCTATGEGAGGALYVADNVALNGSTFKNNAASANGTGASGAILAGMNLTINNSTFTANTATSTGASGAAGNQAVGGAVVGGQIVKITGSTFTSNAASLAGSSPTEVLGGAVFAQTALVSTNNTYTSNAVTTSANVTAAGGALAMLSGSLVSNGDNYSSNSAASAGTAGAGAGILGSGGGTCVFSNGTVASNTVTGAQAVGGGFAFGTACQVGRATVTGNTVTSTAPGSIGAGGGLVDTGGSTILNSTISGNSALTAGGGIISEGNPTIIANSVISGNTVTAASGANTGGGGIFDTSGVELEYATVANNTATIAGVGPAGGGGIFDSSGVALVFSTISGNKVQGSAPNSGGGGVYTSASMLGIDATIGNNSSSVDGGGIDLAGSASANFGAATIYKNAATGNGGNVNIGASATLTLIDSILAGGTAGTGADADNAGTFTSSGYNIVGSAVTGYAPAAGDLPSTDPKLLSLTNNGGATFTFADQAAGVSPGTQHIPFSGAQCGTLSITIDQRGFTRGAGGNCDVGAYEYAGVATAIRHRPLDRLLAKAHFRREGATLVRFPRLKPVRLLEPSKW